MNAGTAVARELLSSWTVHNHLSGPVGLDTLRYLMLEIKKGDKTLFVCKMLTFRYALLVFVKGKYLSQRISGTLQIKVNTLICCQPSLDNLNKTSH